MSDSKRGFGVEHRQWLCHNSRFASRLWGPKVEQPVMLAVTRVLSKHNPSSIRSPLFGTSEQLAMVKPRSRKRNKTKQRTKKQDPLFVDGTRPRPMYVDYKDIDLRKKLINRHGRIVGRRKTGCSAASQHAVTKAIKRARFMALLPYVGE